MSTEFTAQGSIELTQPGVTSDFLQAILTRSEKDPLANFEDVHAELHGQTLRLDVYGTSFSCHDQCFVLTDCYPRVAGSNPGQVAKPR